MSSCLFYCLVNGSELRTTQSLVFSYRYYFYYKYIGPYYSEHNRYSLRFWLSFLQFIFRYFFDESQFFKQGIGDSIASYGSIFEFAVEALSVFLLLEQNYEVAANFKWLIERSNFYILLLVQEYLYELKHFSKLNDSYFLSHFSFAATLAITFALYLLQIAFPPQLSSRNHNFSCKALDRRVICHCQVLEITEGS